MILILIMSGSLARGRKAASEWGRPQSRPKLKVNQLSSNSNFVTKPTGTIAQI